MAVQLSISQEQAKLLIPLLQIVTSQPSAQSYSATDIQKQLRELFEPVCCSRPNSSMEMINNQLNFSTEELLTKAKKNTRSTDAQNLLRVSLLAIYAV